MSTSGTGTRIAFVNGLVADGTGDRTRLADVVVCESHIEAIVPQRLRPETGYDAEIVDCKNRIVAPGFIDLHCHSDLSLIAYPENDSRVGQGITSEVVGNCGMSPAPSGGDIAGLKRVISTINVVPDLKWSFTDIRGWLNVLKGTPTATNVALLVGHSAARFAVAGEVARPLSDVELKLLQYELCRAMESGCVGISLGLMYAPGEGASAEEVAMVAEIVAKYDGLLSVHLRDYSAASLISAINEVANPAREAGARLQISHLRTISKKPSFERVLAHIEQLRTEQDIAADAYPYVHGHTTALQLFPHDVRSLGTLQVLETAESDPVALARLLQHAGYEADEIIIMKAAANPTATGHSLDGVDEDPWMWLTNLLLACNGDVDVAVESGSWRDVDLAMQTPWISIASDGTALNHEHRSSVAHPRSWGAFPAAYKRMRQLGVSVGEAIRRMTYAPGARIGFPSRLGPGLPANLIVFNDTSFDSGATWETPAARALGLDYVMNNGDFLVVSGCTTHERPGAVFAPTQEVKHV